MPSRPSPLWWLTAFILMAYPILNFIYWPQVLRSGVLSPDADSIGIPIYESVLTTIIASPVTLTLAWLCLRRYNPDTTLWTWRQDRLLRSVGTTILFGGASLVIAASVFDSLKQPFIPRYEHLWTAYFMGWLPWLLGLRAAAIDQLGNTPTHTEP